MNLKKIIGSLVLVVTLLFINLNAAEIVIYNDAGKPFTNGETICSNKVYKIDSNSEYKVILILDADTNFVLEVLNANTNVVEIVLPKNVSKVKIISRNFTVDSTVDKSSYDTSTYNVDDCGNAKIKDNYKKDKPKVTFTLNENKLEVHLPTLDGYKFNYQFLGERSKSLNGDSSINMGEETILQFVETYKVDGKEKTFYYEMEVDVDDNYFFSREVSSFEFKKLSAGAIFNIQLIILMIVIIVIILILQLKKRKLKKQYRNKKIDKLRRSRQ